MFVWRLQVQRHPLKNAEGARITGGRWNEEGTPVIYALDTIEPAALEVMVHHGGIPGDIEIARPNIPEGCPGLVPQSITASLGTAWAQECARYALQVPSVADVRLFDSGLRPGRRRIRK